MSQISEMTREQLEARLQELEQARTAVGPEAKCRAEMARKVVSPYVSKETGIPAGTNIAEKLTAMGCKFHPEAAKTGSGNGNSGKVGCDITEPNGTTTFKLTSDWHNVLIRLTKTGSRADTSKDAEIEALKARIAALTAPQDEDGDEAEGELSDVSQPEGELVGAGANS